MAFNATDASAQEMVDLGLSVKWASCNIGANCPSDYGIYFAFGDVQGQTWSKEDRKFSGGGFSEKVWPVPDSYYTKYSRSGRYVLLPNCDAAFTNWGESWRMPTDTEFEALKHNCNLQWIDNYNGTGVSGILFTSKIPGFTDKSIFLPAAGSGCYSFLENRGTEVCYWTSKVQNSAPCYASGCRDVRFFGGLTLSRDGRAGLPIRPVSDSKHVESAGKITSVNLQRISGESDYQFQTRQEIVKHIASVAGITLLSTSDYITYKDGDTIFRLYMIPYKDEPNVILIRLLTLSECNMKEYSLDVFQLVMNELAKKRTMKALLVEENNKGKSDEKSTCLAIAQEMNLANSDNFIKTFDKNRALLKDALSSLPGLCEFCYGVTLRR